MFYIHIFALDVQIFNWLLLGNMWCILTDTGGAGVRHSQLTHGHMIYSMFLGYSLQKVTGTSVLFGRFEFFLFHVPT